MGDVAALHGALLARLRELPTIPAHDGYVPTTPPSDRDGRVYPYSVVWGAGPRRHEDRPLTRTTGDGLHYVALVTVAAGDQTWCLAAAQTVRDHLDGWEPPGAGPLREPDGAPTAVTVRTDRDTKPPRFYVPLEFHTPTT